jgi:hypothetical protein
MLSSITNTNQLSSLRTDVLSAVTLIRSVATICVVAMALNGSLAEAQTGSPKQKSNEAAVKARSLETWRLNMVKRTLPKTSGCFTASAPSRVWKDAPCIEPPNIPMVPRQIDDVVAFVGAGTGISAQAPSGLITSTTGSFDSVTGATSMSSPIGNAGAPVANAYTLQINTEFFASTACAGSPNPNCRGWEQFVYFSNGSNAQVFIQYWLIAYNTSCPAGWNQFVFSGGSTIYCYRNAPNSIPAPVYGVGSLSQMAFTGNVNSGGDSASLSVGTSMFAITGNNSVNASTGWRTAEFNIFGAGGSSSGGGAVEFNAGASLVPRTRITYGGTQAPTCVAQGFTGETNNLNLGPNPPATSAPGPAVAFTETVGAGPVTACSAAMSVGDTHLATIGGLLYDFQATGDFLLAQVGDKFSLQARQVSGGTTWPDASVNHAIAFTSGNTSIALCLRPDGERDRVGLYVDGVERSLEDGAAYGSGSASVRRTGNSFLIRDIEGNVVRAVAHPEGRGRIDVELGLGRWPVSVRGLLANGREGKTSLMSRNGKMFQSPFNFAEFYSQYGNSWRLRKGESKLLPCGETTEISNPKKPLRVRDLNRELVAFGIEQCRELKVPEPLFEACVLDTTVIGNDGAARIFNEMRRPVVVGRFR